MVKDWFTVSTILAFNGKSHDACQYLVVASVWLPVAGGILLLTCLVAEKLCLLLVSLLIVSFSCWFHWLFVSFCWWLVFGCYLSGVISYWCHRLFVSFF